MRRLFKLLVAVMLLSAIPAMTFAQSNDPFEQETLKATNKGNASREKKVDRRKNVEPAAPAPVQKQQPQQVVKQEVKEDNNGMTISNPCEDWLDFEFISLIGNTAKQTTVMTCRVTNHNANTSMYLGGKIVAYDTEGDKHYTSDIGSYYDCLTDVPVKFTFEIPGKMVPSKVSKYNVITFNLGKCRIEMRNVPIEWR